jgi:hypothetical protein
MTTAHADISPIASFPPHFFLENLAVRADGPILVNLLNHKQLWYVPAPVATQPSPRYWCTPSMALRWASLKPSPTSSTSAPSTRPPSSDSTCVAESPEHP